MASRIASRLLIVGWDAADWKVIEALLGRGGMKHLKSMIERGARGDLASLDPKLSPLLWTTIATGKTADKHGILNFLEPDPAGSGLRISCSTTRRVKALWNILTQGGLRTNVVSWYASHPAEPIRGVAVSNLIQEGAPAKRSDRWPMTPGAVHPADVADGIASLRVHPEDVPAEVLLGLIPDLRRIGRNEPRVQLAAKIVAQCMTVDRVASALMAPGREWDCTMVFHEAIDVAGHHFMQYYPPRMEHLAAKDFEQFRRVLPGIYELQDQMLGRMLELAGPGATVILVSDHGFHSDHLRPRVQTALDDRHAAMDATWHRPHGVLAAAGPGIKHGEVHGATLLDIAPTALTLLGLPVGADMDGRVLIEAFDRPVEIARVPSWDAAEGGAGLHPPDLRIDPFEARNAMDQLADLGYVEASSGDSKADLAMCDRETRFNLGVVLMTTSRQRAALDVFERLHGEYPKDARFSMNLAYCLLAAGDHARAIEVLGRLIADSPDNPDARLMQSSALILQGKSEEALRVLRDAAKRTPGRPDVLIALGGAALRIGRYDEAEESLGRAASIDPHDPVVHHQLALLGLARGRYEESAEHALRALELRHIFPEAHYTLGVALAWLDQHDYAAQSFKIALSIQPGMADALEFLAHLARHKGDEAEARRLRAEADRLLKTRGAQSGPDPSRGARLDPGEWAAHAGVEPLRGG